jgi:riboflavin biosynthesis pyrimidine reductase
MLPRVLYHVAASVDGRVDHIEPDLAQFYGIAGRWGEDCIITGADTILAAPDYVEDGPGVGEPASGLPDAGELRGDAADDGEAADRGGAAWAETPAAGGKPLLAVVDARGRVRNWRALKALTDYWRGLVPLVSRATPAEALARMGGAGLDALVVGDERVDLGAALQALAGRYGVQRVRVDSGGSLAGALLRAGLVHEVSVLVQPALVGGELPRSIFRAAELDGPGRVVRLALLGLERLEGDVVWLRYEVAGRS